MTSFVVAKMVRLVPNAAVGYLKSIENELFWLHPDNEEEAVNLNLQEIETILIDSISSTALLSTRNQIKMMHFLQEKDLNDFISYLRGLKDSKGIEETESSPPYLKFIKKQIVHEVQQPPSELDEATLNVLDAFAKIPLLARSLFKQLKNEPQDLYRPRGIPTARIPTNPWIYERPLQLPACRMHFEPSGSSNGISGVPEGLKATMVYNSAGKILKAEERREFWSSILKSSDKIISRDNTQTSEDYNRIEKDLHRLGEEDSVVIERLKGILQLYSKQDAEVGYVQGMADLALPFARLFDTTDDGFACFYGLMKRVRSNFLAHKSETGIEQQLKRLRALIHESSPLLSDYLKFNRDCDDLFFAYRWLLLLFRREFVENDRLWDVMLAAEQAGIVKIEEFRLFVALAMILSKKGEFMNTCIRFEDLLKYFNDLSGKWELDDILQLTDQLINYFKVK